MSGFACVANASSGAGGGTGKGQASTLSTLSGRKTMDISRINGSINDLHENGLLRLLVPVGGRATPPADISSPSCFVEVHEAGSAVAGGAVTLLGWPAAARAAAT